MISDSVLPAGHSRQCFPKFSDRECLIETPESVWALFSLPRLLEFCQMAYLGYSVLYLTHQDLPRPNLHPFVSFTASWSEFWRFLTALQYALTCSSFSLFCNGGRSSMNLMVCMNVSGNRLCFSLVIMTLAIDRPLNSEEQ